MADARPSKVSSTPYASPYSIIWWCWSSGTWWLIADTASLYINHGLHGCLEAVKIDKWRKQLPWYGRPTD
jgi:hypothetical protein